VLDSNVVLDWLVFGDPSARTLAEAVRFGRVRWIATAAMFYELEHVLTRSVATAWKVKPQDVLAQWDRWVRPVEAPMPALGSPLHCTDPDDQKFIDLALHAGATALLSRDRAVLKLAGRARRLGLTIQTAAAWSAS
jgi:predicted nucleic acid-binding protein